MISLTIKHRLRYLFFYASLQLSLQYCPDEVSYNGISVKWTQTSDATGVESDPLCFINDELVTRNCTDDKWTPTVEDVGPCLKTVKSFNATSCPPNFYKISEHSHDYCFGVGVEEVWDYPCFSSGSGTIITDLDDEEIQILIDTLVAVNKSRYYWLPAKRQKMLTPVVWYIPGPNWGASVKTIDILPYHNLIWKNCLALDIQQRILTTDSCTERYPNLCFYINDIHYPASCPNKYHTFRYRPDNGTCYGIETSDIGLTFENFQMSKCKNPMTDNQIPLNRFIFTRIAELNKLPNDQWCWFKLPISESENHDKSSLKTDFSSTNVTLEAVINSVGTLRLIDSSENLFCMACETDVIYSETELIFEYNEAINQIHLTIYFPSGLWRYDNNDKGIQCFSDARGFIEVVNINDIPFLSVKHEIQEGVNQYIEKVIYVVDLITDRSAQYWCEGHTLNFSLISTEKLVVNPKGKDTHVFALTVKFYNATYEIVDNSRINLLISHLYEIFDAKKVLWMDVFDINLDYITVLLHLHATIESKHNDDALNILETLNNLQDTAILGLPSINCSFVNLTSSLYCLPTTSNDTIVLNWGLTPIGHITAPKEFCLQSNGLPVKRQCLGSYLNGAFWGRVEGQCDFNYIPTVTTAFLYDIGIGQAPSNYTSSFLTEGLEFVLSDINIIIPADIYYLSMSLQQILHIAQQNKSSVEIGDIDNIAWVTDRVMRFNCDYLRLSQTLNSTNVILNSVNEIIEMIANPSIKATFKTIDSETNAHTVEMYKLSIKPQFVVQISYPAVTNITGISISRTSDSERFTDMIIKPLYANTSLDHVLEIENLEIAAWLPLKLLNTLKPNNNDSLSQDSDLHVIVSVFQNDAIFQELVVNNHIINSRIIGVSVPGFIPNFEYPLPIVFRQLSQLKKEKHCGFWDFKMENSTKMSGFWQTQGCFPVISKKNITVCECYHLTHFSQLISMPTGPDSKENSAHHTKALNLITLIGCFLSLVGIAGIWITALVFSNWRKKAGTKVLLQLSTAIALPLMFIVVFNLDNSIFIYENDTYIIASHRIPLCIILGSLLHYSIIASFMWMLITAILQFIRYVRVLGVSRPSRFMVKFCLIGWGIPIIPVIIVLSIDAEGYIPDLSHHKRLCYPKDYYFIFAVLVPICVILLTNIILFFMVLHSISRRSNEKTKATDYDLVGAQLRLSVFLIFLLGLTWIFGIFSFSGAIIWSYLFCLSSTLQGFVLFIYFIICDPMTRNMWITLIKPPLSSDSTRDSITTYN